MSVRIVKYGIAIMLLSFVALLSSCASSNVREAHKVVAQADSLWHEGKMYGVDMGDSATLAQSYETLNSFIHCTSSLCTSFAHACYHYGKLLRAKDDPVSAMQVFIDATHSQTDDYHILGRVYSNMGSICHLAGEFQLSYDMYEKSAEEFLRNGDTLLYYYDLNNMAFELAEQGDKVRIKTLLDSIQTYNHPQVFLKSQETLAMLHLRKKHYAETIDIINDMQAHSYTDILGYLMKSQAYEHLGRLDSAVLNARIVASNTNDHRYLISAYYILSHKDKNLSADSVLLLTSLRADAQKEWAIRHAKYSNAAQILEQDLNRKPDWRWLYAVLTTLIFVAAGISIYVYRKRQRQALLAQKLESLQQATSYIQKKNEKLTECYRQNQKQILEDIDKKCAMLQDPDKIKKSLAWKDYNKMCNIVDKQFYLLASKLKTKYLLNETEVRLCVLVLLDMSRADIAHLLPYALSSVGKLKDQTAKKIGTTGKYMRNYLIDRAIEG